MRKLKDIKIVDKRHSKVNLSKSNIKKGLLEFRGTPKYIATNEQQMVKEERMYRPDHKLHWVSKETQGGRDLQQWKWGRGFSEVTIDDPYYPVGVEYNGSGHFQFMDMILMKCPLEHWLEQKIREQKKANAARKARVKEFKDSLGEASIEDGLLQQLLGSETEVG